jgi:hypothetical protein
MFYASHEPVVESITGDPEVIDKEFNQLVAYRQWAMGEIDRLRASTAEAERGRNLINTTLDAERTIRKEEIGKREDIIKGMKAWIDTRQTTKVIPLGEKVDVFENGEKVVVGGKVEEIHFLRGGIQYKVVYWDDQLRAAYVWADSVKPSTEDALLTTVENCVDVRV